MSLLYSNLKFLRYQDRLEALRERKVVAPVHVRIKPINHCNHSCWYCAYRADNLQLGDGIDLKDQIAPEKMQEIVEDIIEMGVEAVTFSGGGEPLLYKSLPQILARLATGGVRVAALTNGSNLQGRVADAFAEHGTWVRVSLDAWDGPSYAKSRGIHEGAFDRLIGNMRNFAARNSKCVLGASFIIGVENHEHIHEVCALMKEVGVNHVKLTGAIVGNNAQENVDYHSPISAMVHRQIEQARTLSDETFSILDHYHQEVETFEKEYSVCPFSTFLTIIGADGNVYSCQDKAYTESGCLGSLEGRRFRDFWFSDEAADRIYGIDPKNNCRHHCIANAKNLSILEYLSIDTEHARFV